MFYFPRETLALQPYVPNLTFGTIEFRPIPIVPTLEVTQFFLFDRLGPLCIDKGLHVCVIRKYHHALLPLLCDRKIWTKTSPQAALRQIHQQLPSRSAFSSSCFRLHHASPILQRWLRFFQKERWCKSIGLPRPNQCFGSGCVPLGTLQKRVRQVAKL